MATKILEGASAKAVGPGEKWECSPFLKRYGGEAPRLRDVAGGMAYYIDRRLLPTRPSIHPSWLEKQTNRASDPVCAPKTTPESSVAFSNTVPRPPSRSFPNAVPRRYARWVLK